MTKHLRNTKGAGGLRDIQKKLEISKCRIVALRAGHSYHDCIAKESTRKVRHCKLPFVDSQIRLSLVRGGILGGGGEILEAKVKFMLDKPP